MTLPPLITPDDLARARTLVAVAQQRSRALFDLRRRLAHARRRETESAKLFDERLEFRRFPGRLDGLAEFYQRQHPKSHRRIEWAYRSLLREMIDPLKTLDLAMTPKPLTIDMFALPLDARPYLLGPYLGLHQRNRFAEVDLRTSRPNSDRIVYVQTGGPVDINVWRGHMPAINAWLTGGIWPWTWAITDHSASTVTLTRQSKLPAIIPFERTMLAPGALFVGIDTVQRTPVHIPFSELTSGTYIPGAAGSGKTSALHVILRSLFANLDLFSAVYLVDGKDGVAMSRYGHLHDKVHVLYDEPDVWALAASLTALMKTRNAEQRAQGIDKATSDYVALVIDELPTYVAKPPKAQRAEHEAFLDNLQKIAMRGRSAGIRMFLISQSPVADQIPVAIRSNCSTTIAFRLPETVHATAVFGTLDATNDPRKLATGQAIVLQSDAGKITSVQFPFAPLYQPPRPT